MIRSIIIMIFNLFLLMNFATCQNSLIEMVDNNVNFEINSYYFNNNIQSTKKSITNRVNKYNRTVTTFDEDGQTEVIHKYYFNKNNLIDSIITTQEPSVRQSRTKLKEVYVYAGKRIRAILYYENNILEAKSNYNYYKDSIVINIYNYTEKREPIMIEKEVTTYHNSRTLSYSKFNFFLKKNVESFIFCQKQKNDTLIVSKKDLINMSTEDSFFVNKELVKICFSNKDYMSTIFNSDSLYKTTNYYRGNKILRQDIFKKFQDHYQIIKIVNNMNETNDGYTREYTYRKDGQPIGEIIHKNGSLFSVSIVSFFEKEVQKRY